MSRFHNRNFELLEPYEGKLSRTVLRGVGSITAPDLLDLFIEDSEENLSKRQRPSDAILFCSCVTQGSERQPFLLPALRRAPKDHVFGPPHNHRSLIIASSLIVAPQDIQQFNNNIIGFDRKHQPYLVSEIQYHSQPHLDERPGRLRHGGLARGVSRVYNRGDGEGRSDALGRPPRQRHRTGH